MNIIGSAIYYKLLDYLNQYTVLTDYHKQVENNDDDVMSKQIYKYDDLSSMLNDKIWTEYMYGIFNSFFTKLMAIIK